MKFIVFLAAEISMGYLHLTAKEKRLRPNSGLR